MKKLEFSWDHRKAETNKQKHGVSFEEAQSVFYDGNARIIHDLDHSEDEDRFILLGISLKLRMLVVSHCYRAQDSVIRIISARRATERERGKYGGPLP